MRKTRYTRPNCQMYNVEIWEDTPQAINLRVVSVDLRDDETDAAQEEGCAEPRHQGVGLDVSLFEAINASNIVEYPVRETVELVDEGFDCLRVVATVLEGLECRESHCKISNQSRKQS